MPIEMVYGFPYPVTAVAMMLIVAGISLSDSFKNLLKELKPDAALYGLSL